MRAVPDALQQGTHQQAASNISDAELPHRAQSAHAAAPSLSSLQVKTTAQHKKEALEALGKFAACKDEWAEDSVNWRWLTVAATLATNSLHDMCSKTTLQSLVRSSSSPEFATSAEALPGNGLKRKRSFVDPPSKRKSGTQPQSRFGPPFVGVRLPQAKPKSELQSIRSKNAQLGVQPAARAIEIAASQDRQLSSLQSDSGDSAEAGPSHLHHDGAALQQPHRARAEAPAPANAARTQHREAGCRPGQERRTDTSAAVVNERPRRKARLPKGLVDFDTAG